MQCDNIYYYCVVEIHCSNQDFELNLRYVPVHGARVRDGHIVQGSALAAQLDAMLPKFVNACYPRQVSRTTHDEVLCHSIIAVYSTSMHVFSFNWFTGWFRTFSPDFAVCFGNFGMVKLRKNCFGQLRTFDPKSVLRGSFTKIRPIGIRDRLM